MGIFYLLLVFVTGIAKTNSEKWLPEDFPSETQIGVLVAGQHTIQWTKNYQLMTTKNAVAIRIREDTLELGEIHMAENFRIFRKVGDNAEEEVEVRWAGPGVTYFIPDKELIESKDDYKFVFLAPWDPTTPEGRRSQKVVYEATLVKTGEVQSGVKASRGNPGPYYKKNDGKDSYKIVGNGQSYFLIDFPEDKPSNAEKWSSSDFPKGRKVGFTFGTTKIIVWTTAYEVLDYNGMVSIRIPEKHLMQLGKYDPNGVSVRAFLYVLRDEKTKVEEIKNIEVQAGVTYYELDGALLESPRAQPQVFLDVGKSRREKFTTAKVTLVETGKIEGELLTCPGYEGVIYKKNIGEDSYAKAAGGLSYCLIQFDVKETVQIS